MDQMPWIARALTKGVLKFHKNNVVNQLLHKYKIVK
jgi:hypothetical protein